jgi:hypothetical protein
VKQKALTIGEIKAVTLTKGINGKRNTVRIIQSPG